MQNIKITQLTGKGCDEYLDGNLYQYIDLHLIQVIREANKYTLTPQTATVERVWVRPFTTTVNGVSMSLPMSYGCHGNQVVVYV